MAEDAITDEAADLNPLKGIRIRACDPRGEEETKADPRLQLRGDAPLRQGGRDATRRWSAFSPTPA
jgi:hypothetical protein